MKTSVENPNSSIAIVPEAIENKIFLIRGLKVMIDKDLAALYGVPTKRLNEAVKRNLKRFPDDFMFLLNKDEANQVYVSQNLSRSQFATLKQGHNIKYQPYAFTEQGIAMLSTVLNSERAIHVNIAIMRAFVKLRQILSGHKELAHKLTELEHKIERHDEDIIAIFDAIRQIMKEESKPKGQWGFVKHEERR